MADEPRGAAFVKRIIPTYGTVVYSTYADALDFAADALALEAFRTNPPAFLTISAKRQAAPKRKK
jgi:hypothetical protein